MNQNPYTPPKARVDDISLAPAVAPSLWNPKAAVLWSLLFTPAFGAYLHQRNWRALGQPEQARQAILWMIGGGLLDLGIIALAAFMPPTEILPRVAANATFVMFAFWLQTGAKAQIQFVARHYGDDYPREDLSVPILFGAIGLIAVFALWLGVH